MSGAVTWRRPIPLMKPTRWVMRMGGRAVILRRMSVRPVRVHWPLLFSLQPSTLDLLETADYVYELQRDFRADGRIVVATFFDDVLVGRVTGLRGFTWLTPLKTFDAALIQEHFDYMSLQMRTVAWTPGRTLATSIDRCSLPLGRQMLQVMDTTPLPGGGCRFRWRIAVRYLPGMSPLAPMVTPMFRRMFEQTLDAVDRLLSAPPPPQARGVLSNSGS